MVDSLMAERKAVEQADIEEESGNALRVAYDASRAAASQTGVGDSSLSPAPSFPEAGKSGLPAMVSLVLTGAWIIAWGMYVQTQVGWSALVSLPVLDLGVLVLCLVMPPTVLWLIIDRLDQGRRARREWQVLQWHLEQLTYPNAMAEERVRTVADSLRRQSDLLNTTSENAAARATKINQMLESRCAHLDQLSQTVDSRAMEMRETLRQQARDLASESDRAIARAKEAGNILHHQAHDLRAVSAEAASQTQTIGETLQLRGAELLSAADVAAQKSQKTADMLSIRADRIAAVSETALGQATELDASLHHMVAAAEEGAARLSSAGESAFERSRQTAALLGDQAEVLEARVDATMGRAERLEATVARETDSLAAAAARMSEAAMETAQTLSGQVASLAETADHTLERARLAGGALGMETARLGIAADDAASRLAQLSQALVERSDQLGSVQAQSATFSDSLAGWAARLDTVGIKMTRRMAEAEELLQRQDGKLAESTGQAAERLKGVGQLISALAAQLRRTVTDAGTEITQVTEALHAGAQLSTAEAETAVGNITAVAEALHLGIGALQEAAAQSGQTGDRTQAEIIRLRDLAGETREGLRTLCDAVSGETHQLGLSAEKLTIDLDGAAARLDTALADMETVGSRTSSEVETLAERLSFHNQAISGAADTLGGKLEDLESSGQRLRGTLADITADLAQSQSQMDDTSLRASDLLDAAICRFQEGTRLLSGDAESATHNMDAAAGRLQTTTERVRENAQQAESLVDSVSRRLLEASESFEAKRGHLGDATREMGDTFGALVEKVDLALSRLHQGQADMRTETQGLGLSVDQVEARLQDLRQVLAADSEQLDQSARAAADHLRKAQAQLVEGRDSVIDSSATATAEMQTAAQAIHAHTTDLDTAVGRATGLMGLINTALDRNRADLESASESVDQRSKQTTALLRGLLEDLRAATVDTLEQMNGAGDLIHNRLANISVGSVRAGEDMDRLATALEAAAESLSRASASAVTELDVVGKRLSQRETQTVTAADEAAAKLENVGAVALRRGEAISAVAGKIGDGVAILDRGLGKALDDLGKLGASLVARADEARTATDGATRQIENWDTAVKRATDQLRSNSDRVTQKVEVAVREMSRNTLEMEQAAQRADRVAKLLGDLYDRASAEAFLRRATLIQEALQSAAIDVSRSMEVEVTETDWKRYSGGDKGLFLRKLGGLRDKGALEKARALYAEDGDFRGYVDRYLREFETLTDRAADYDPNGAMGATFLSSDMGKLFLLLSQVVHR
ncbi:MAG: hypothetical protein ACPGO3_05215 [Magnetospiraceae bacterium]